MPVETRSSQRGAVLLDGTAAKCVTSVERHSDRLLVVNLHASPRDIVLIQVYMPTTAHTDEEVDVLYEQMEAILQEMKGDVMVLGDWNAVVGESPEDDCVGKFGLGNDRGQKLVEFRKRNRMMITNTRFKHDKRRRYTRKSPGDYARYQLDYILVKTRYRNSVLNAHTWAGADADTDHNLLVVKIRIALEKLSQHLGRWDKENLKNKIVEFANNVDSKLAQVSPIQKNQMITGKGSNML